MFRFLISALDLCATFFAILSPVAIVYWICSTFPFDGADTITKPLSVIFGPFTYVIDSIFHPPSIEYEGKSTSIAAGIVAIVFTGFFFVASLVANLVRAIETKLQVTKEALDSKRKLQKAAAERRREEEKVVEKKKQIVFLQFPFDKMPDATQHFEGYKNRQGRILLSYPDSLMLEFPTITDSMDYCSEAAKNLLTHYLMLRPIDPQPPFYLALHAIHLNEDPSTGAFDKIRHLVRYCGQNQVVLSQEMKRQLDAEKMSSDYKIQSLGIYDFPMEKNQEVYQFIFSKPDIRRRY